MVEVEEDREGQRVDNFLLGQLKGVPRTLIYRLLRTGQVRVDGRRCKADQRLQAGQQVRIPPIREASAGAPVAASNSMLDSLQARIVAEDELTLVLDKPSGLASHGGSGISYGAIEAMRQARPNQTLELVHRLDRDTSGLLVLAKKRAALLQSADRAARRQCRQALPGAAAWAAGAEQGRRQRTLAQAGPVRRRTDGPRGQRRQAFAVALQGDRALRCHHSGRDPDRHR
jgi:23S rRNA-/tRNA-specific pseudouridylate synthase